MAGALKAARDPDVAVPAAILIGMLVWGPNGALLFDVEQVLGLDPVDAWMVRFAVGALFVVVIPALVIRFWIRPDDDALRKLDAWGFGLGDAKRGALYLAIASVIGCAVMWFGTSQNGDIQGEYPLFAPGPGDPPLEMSRFVGYEAVYFLFFLCGEAAMRGMLLFGLERKLGGKAAIAITALIQMVWHLGKPLAELAIAPVWGVVIGAFNLRLRSFWWMLVFHWLTNVILDLAIHYHR